MVSCLETRADHVSILNIWEFQIGPGPGSGKATADRFGFERACWSIRCVTVVYLGDFSPWSRVASPSVQTK